MSAITEGAAANPGSTPSVSVTRTVPSHPQQYHHTYPYPSHQRYPGGYPMTADMVQIANFRPSPREVISGIAPHVFDERKRRRSQRRAVRPPSWYGQSEEKRSSPLRGATIIAWDEHSIYLEQTDVQVQRAAAVDKHESRPGSVTPPEDEISKESVKTLDKSNWKSFRVDKQLLKTLRTKLTGKGS